MSCTSPEVPPTPIVIKRGQSSTIPLTVDPLGALIDITAAKLWFSVKNRFEDVAAVIFKRNLLAGGVDEQIKAADPQTGAGLGKATVYLVPADTLNLSSDESYWCDAWVELSTGERYQIMPNTPFKIDPAVTTQFN